jgi:hypothetical protein
MIGTEMGHTCVVVLFVPVYSATLLLLLLLLLPTAKELIEYVELSGYERYNDENEWNCSRRQHC